MMKQRWILGLPVLLAFVLLVACGDEPTGAPTPETPRDEALPDEAPPVDVPKENHCNWPEFCGPPMAREMLDEIAARADAAAGDMDPADLQIIHERVDVCRLPDLRNKKGKHVCELKTPLACDELKQIWKKTSAENIPADPAQRPGHWHTIAQDLESFPSGQ